MWGDDVTFQKHYVSVDRWAAALSHHALLTELDVIHLPALLDADLGSLTISWQHIPSARPLAEQDLPRVAHEMGRLHTAARRILSDPGRKPPRIAGWAAPRASRLRTLLHRGLAPGASLDADHVDNALVIGEIEPACLYKDSNVRNYLVTHDDVLVTVDVDDLTLAPPGYDLAKLLLSWALTTGDLTAPLLSQCQTAYNEAVDLTVNPGVNRRQCSLSQLLLWLEVNYVLTAPYLGRNGYEHSWPSQRDQLETVLGRD